MDDSIEISYNSAGVLAHLVSDGVDAWKVVTTKREDVMQAIMKVSSISTPSLSLSLSIISISVVFPMEIRYSSFHKLSIIPSNTPSHS